MTCWRKDPVREAQARLITAIWRSPRCRALAYGKNKPREQELVEEQIHPRAW